MLVSVALLPRYIIHDKRIEYYKNGVPNGVAIFQVEAFSLATFIYTRDGRRELKIKLHERHRYIFSLDKLTEYKNGKLHGIKYRSYYNIDLEDYNNFPHTLRRFIDGNETTITEGELALEYTNMGSRYMMPDMRVVLEPYARYFDRKLEVAQLPILNHPRIQLPNLGRFPQVELHNWKLQISGIPMPVLPAFDELGTPSCTL